MNAIVADRVLVRVVMVHFVVVARVAAEHGFVVVGVIACIITMVLGSTPGGRRSRTCVGVAAVAARIGRVGGLSRAIVTIVCRRRMRVVVMISKGTSSSRNQGRDHQTHGTRHDTHHEGSQGYHPWG